jgi:hypothetical protein
VPLAETMVQTRKTTVESTNAMEAATVKSTTMEATNSTTMETAASAAMEATASAPAMRPSVGGIWLAERRSA